MSIEIAPRPVRKVTVINGSPRKGWNTATLLAHAAEGARSEGATIGWVDLYGLDFKGCRSCFACKTRGGKSYGHCAQRDGLSPVWRAVMGIAPSIKSSLPQERIA